MSRRPRSAACGCRFGTIPAAGDLRYPGARSRGRGVGRGRTPRRGRAAPLQLPRCVRLQLELRLRGLIEVHPGAGYSRFMAAQPTFLVEPPPAEAAACMYDEDRSEDGYVWNVTRLWAWRPDGPASVRGAAPGADGRLVAGRARLGRARCGHHRAAERLVLLARVGGEARPARRRRCPRRPAGAGPLTPPGGRPA